ncbi:tRNA uridine-5-carboxymethylaminomethyl(34) synthesis GTPase MnmE [Rhodobium orientis]|uniref:tRNA modification GTPase MnmE n=1 Tax=Rhodobium orientis TaxID=34017 RepID=A0A327JT36_9HYPH|nr:tRNA uridine-5-carboxymethylaminomethyl(34) synthesis GTPase MnmE [Rhodobium orientis]MBK5948224.1 tRNA uridine-5-carboxymethylaminomethyl(34) synthesis GTPase MnmE [Rhodobium orientis]RAI28785.1 tRNA uridine-5-carboxymethylaminomethyl(34) synthesis GTPase MnmE [Rhodobium orientis]
MDNRTGTIFALSSGALPSAIAVVRLSGPRVRFVLETMAGIVPEPRRAMLRALKDPRDGAVLDEAVVLFFEGPASATGEDVAEFHVHGGRAVVGAVLEALGSFEGVRPAEAGEFSRRAFDNGKLDLTRVEGLADLIAAETEAQRRQALSQLCGSFGDLVEGWRRRLIGLRARIEAGLDFAEEEDVLASVTDADRAVLSDLRIGIETKLGEGRSGERLRDGLQVALMGPPNAGKSSLMNALAKRDVAIVTEEAGTTRDVLEVHLDLSGYPVMLIDTAGLREAEGIVEREGIRRALARGSDADLVLWMEDASGRRTGVPDGVVSAAGTVWPIANKADLVGDGFDAGDDALAISVKTGAGLDRLQEKLAAFAGEKFAGLGSAMATRERHRAALTACRDALVRAEAVGDAELMAEELRHAGDALGRITGRIDVEDVLDVIFAEFCIGK